MKRRHALPAEVYALVDQTPATVLLEGGKPGNPTQTHQEPWTHLFTAPLRICAAWHAEEIPALFAAIERALQAGHYAAGFFTYECGYCFEPKAGTPQAIGRPLAWFGIYEHGYKFDHQAGQFIGGNPPGLASLHQHAGSIAEPAAVDAAFALSEAEYARSIAAIHEWIRSGDVYQLNFTAPWRVAVHGSAAALYAQLRQRQPVDYGAFLHWSENQRVLSFSPELFFRVEATDGSRRIVTRPMKGTAPRGRSTREDRARAEWLSNDPKNRSENVMIVDLLRNDLGRLARFGTVRADELFTVERYPTLWQLTSTVTAELRDDVGYEQIFRALFPSGSITGAPKVRAMQLIAALEDTPRGVYTGAIGFFSPQRTVFNVAIRTLELHNDPDTGHNAARGIMGAGSGVVIDSDAASEYRECLLKAEFLTRTPENFPQEFSLIETMLWKTSYPFIELHLDRLLDSADYFDIACDREAIRAGLETYAQAFTGETARRVRLLLNRSGSLAITDEPLAASDPDRIGRVRLSQTRTDPADPMLFHKTTHRPIYAEAFKAASQDGYDDILFLNLRGELTEGAISNVFIEKNSRWSTPPIECGVLAGVYRRHLLESRIEIEEKILYVGDLLQADAIYLANALRGLRRVQLESKR